MALLEFKVDLEKAVRELRRIADALERFHHKEEEPPVTPADIGDLYFYGQSKEPQQEEWEDYAPRSNYQ